jgi:U32 family peptidase
MKLTTFAETLHDIGLAKELGLTEIILGHKELSRFGKLSTTEFQTLSQRAKEFGLRVICEWDILMTENTFAAITPVVFALLDATDVLRVQDPGALEWSLNETNKPVQFIAENGNHNLAALKGWIDHSEGRMDRIVLSIELSRDVIAEYTQKLSVPCELLGLGRILLFYTPRSLLSPLAPEKFKANEEISALGESEESPHKGFPILENRHGTFMFHIKEFCLLEYAADLNSLGLAFLRLDLRFGMHDFFRETVALVNAFDPAAFDGFKESFPQDFMRGFYLVNKTDVLFPKLKNHRLQKRDGNFVGEILDAEKGSHLAIMIKNPKGLKSTDRLRILHPKGEEFDIKIHWLKNLSHEEVSEIGVDQMAIIPFVEGVWVKSQVFYIS